MKFATRKATIVGATRMTALALALAAGGMAVIAGAPADAKDKKPEAEKPTSYDLSKPVRDAVAAAQKALTAGDTATAATQVDTALAAAKTDDDRFVASSVLFDISKKTNDQAQQRRALAGMLAGDRLAPDQRSIILLSLGQAALTANDTATADRMLTEAVQKSPNDNNGYALLAETKVKEGKPADAVVVFQQAMDHAKASGTKLPADFYGRAVNIAYTAKLPDQTEALTEAWVAAYPSHDNWRDSLVTWRDLHKPDADLALDFMRFQRVIGAMKGQSDYLELVDDTYLRFPGEAKGVLDEAVKAGVVAFASNQNAREISGIVNGKVAADKASLGASATVAKGPKGTGRTALNTADGYASYGDFANAVTMYRVALQKSGVDANLVNTRLGAALAQSGDKAGAKTVFATITGPRASLAKYWMVWLDGPPAA